DCMTQEFQWARSLVAILFTVTPGCSHRLPGLLRAQFLFTQLWYPIFGAMMFFSYLIPIMAIASQTPWVSVSYPAFLLHGAPSALITLLIAYWVRMQGWLRPPEAPLLSWENAAYQLARWPWVLL